MGLRFRKSVTLCKGVKLNFGKTGMSVSVGGKGYHKTINTKGQVTTSVGIPGSGIYLLKENYLGPNVWKLINLSCLHENRFDLTYIRS